MFVAASKLQVHAGQEAGWLSRLAGLARLPAQCSAMVRSLIDIWPEEVYSKPIVEARLLGRKIFFVSDPRLIRTLLVDHEGSLEREEIALRALVPALGNGILTSDGAAWRVQRRTAAAAFTPAAVRGLTPLMAQAARSTAARWSMREPGAPIDLLREMMRSTLEIILAALVSGDGNLDVVAFGQAIETYIEQTNWKMAYAALGVPAWLPHPGAVAGLKAARYARAAIDEVVTMRRRRPEPRGDLLDMLLDAKDPETGLSMSDQTIVDNLLTFVAAGHETTALALSWTFRLLCEHPDVEERVLAEIKTMDADMGSDPAAVDCLVYTKQVLMEAMRLYPPAPLIVRRTVDAIRLGDVTVPAGCSVHVPIYALHRRPQLWHRPALFDPDRFAPAVAANRERFAHIPFGAGPRVCIGASLAVTECLVVLATLLPRFDLRAAHAAMPEAQMRVTLRPKGGMPMHVTARANSHD